jgi:prolyl-tRNA synthetase
MGCYGIGVSRLMGVIAELFSDNKGLIWNENIAPFKVYLARIGDGEVETEADKIYDLLIKAGVDVLYDDREVSAGQKFADSELLGIPYRLTISERSLSSGTYELTTRIDHEIKMLTLEQLLAKLG